MSAKISASSKVLVRDLRITELRFKMTQSSSSSSSSGSSQYGSDSESEKPQVKSSQKRNVEETDSDTDSDSNSTAISTKDVEKQKKAETKGKKRKVDEENAVEEEEEDVKVLSHKEQRRLKKKQKLMEKEAVTEGQEAESEAAKESSKQSSKKKSGKEKNKKAEETEALQKRQNSIWVGNLSFKTTEDALKTFFEGVGEITRIHMPKKSNPGAPKLSKPENRGFAYVDFATPEARTLAVTLSEKNLDGRKLLIKSGEDFSGRPAPATVSTLGTNGEVEAGPSTGLTKTAQKILSSQKQPPGPCLFLGNLGFEATEGRIREMFEGHAKSWAIKQAEREREKAKKREKGKSKRDDDDLMDTREDEKEEDEVEVSIDVGIKKVRMGTFEDSGVCKGFAFIDFTSTAHATAALTNPRNHYLDGRTLKVEYASPDAARRGGYREKGATSGKTDGSRPPRKSSGTKTKDGGYAPKRKWGESGTNDGESVVEESNVDYSKNEEAGEESKSKRPRQQDDRNGKNRRPRPGAALAMAKRENYAIVKSEGTRLTFS